MKYALGALMQIAVFSAAIALITVGAVVFAYAAKIAIVLVKEAIEKRRKG